MTFSEFVTSQRMKLHLEKHELAEKAKIPDAWMTHIEDGVRIPKDLYILYALADALQVDRKWFREFAYVNGDPNEAS